MSKRKAGPGRNPLPKGEGKIRKTLSFSPEAVEILDGKHNMSAYVDALIMGDSKMPKYRQVTVIHGGRSIEKQINPEQLVGCCHECYLELGDDWRENVSADGMCRCDECHEKWEAR